jgi:hypothetical protein
MTFEFGIELSIRVLVWLSVFRTGLCWIKAFEFARTLPFLVVFL